MFNFILAIHIIVAIAMTGLILIQHGKGADAGASFGAGASGTVFGAAGSANFLTRATAVLTAIFFATSLLLAINAREHVDNAREHVDDQYSLDVETQVVETPEVSTSTVETTDGDESQTTPE